MERREITEKSKRALNISLDLSSSLLGEDELRQGLVVPLKIDSCNSSQSATEQFANFLRYMQSASYSGRPRAGHLGREY